MDDRDSKGAFTAGNTSAKANKGKKYFKTRFLEALERISKTEDDFIDNLVSSAIDPSDNTIALAEVLKRAYPLSKQVAPCVQFEFPDNGKPHEQAAAVMKGVAEGIIPPDIGATFVHAIKSTVDIEESTELKDRIAKIEAALGV